MKRIISISIALALLAFSAFGREEAGWQTDLTATLQQAKTNQRPILVEFSAPWCPYCRSMETKVFKDQKVAGALGQFTKVAVNIDWNAEEAAQYGIHGIPAFVMLDYRGQAVAKTAGFMEAGPFERWLSDGMTNLTFSAVQQQEFDGRRKAVEAALASPDAETRAKGLSMALDCAERHEQAYRDFGTMKLQEVAKAEPALLIDGLMHPALGARIQVANLLREKFGDDFKIDPWDGATAREKGVAAWKARLAVKGK